MLSVDHDEEYAPRPGINFTELDLPENAYVHRLENYRRLNPWWSRLWRPKYDEHLIAIIYYSAAMPPGGEIRDITAIANEMLKRAKDAK